MSKDEDRSRELMVDGRDGQALLGLTENWLSSMCLFSESSELFLKELRWLIVLVYAG